MNQVLTFCAFRPAMAGSVYKKGFKAELIGRTSTAVQAYTSAEISARSVSARIPKIKLDYHSLAVQSNWNCLGQFRGIRPRMYTSRVYFDNVTLKSHNMTLTSQKPCLYNNQFDCCEPNGYNIPHDAINEV